MILSPRTLEIRPSFRLSVAEAGPPNAPALILVPGLSDTWRSFAPLVSSLEPSWRVIAVSQRGHGDSSASPSRYTPPDFAADLADLMDHLALPQAILIGHCLGGFTVRHFAATYPQRVRAAVLLATFNSTQQHPVIEDLWHHAIAEMRDPVDPAFVEDFQRSTIAQFVPEPFFETIVQESLKMPARVWKAAITGLRTAEAPSAFDAPCWLAWGDRDTVIAREEQSALCAQLPQARLTVYEGTGHSPHWELPHRVARDLCAFLTETA